MHQTESVSAGAPSQTPLRELTSQRSSDPYSWTLGVLLQKGERKYWDMWRGEKWRERKGRRRKGKESEGKRGESTHSHF